MPSLDHLTITAADFTTSFAFYDAALDAIGWTRALELGDEEEEDANIEVVAWGASGSEPVLWLAAGTTPTTGLHVALQVAEPTLVTAFHDTAVAAGGSSHDAPRRWAIIRRGRFNAIVADPAGNLIEVVSPE